uniref:Uncharacterized protein n=1 Tax=Ditylenchus dipsaci TaxID=166011 RepID=A0A915DQ72_9BILA
MTDQSQATQELIEDTHKSIHFEEPKAAVEVPLPASTDRIDKAISGDGHLRIIGALCLILWTAHHDLCLIFVLIPFLIACFLKIGEQLGVKDSFLHFAHVAWTGVQENVQKLINIVAAGSLRNFVKLLFTSDRLFVSSLSTKVDLISSICVMVVVAVSSLFVVLFVVFQVHSETVHLIKLGGNVVSSNPDWLRFAMNYTEGQFREHDIDDYVEQAYQKGRKWAALNIRSLADPTDTDRADHLEQQANLLIDNLYRMWEDRHSENVNNSTTNLLWCLRVGIGWLKS